MALVISFIRSLFCRHQSLTFVRNIWRGEIEFAGGKRSLWRCERCSWTICKDTLHRKPNGEYAP